MPIRTIDAPGIEMHEIDKSQYSPAMTGTKVLVTGFANSGEDYTPMIFTSKSAWLNYYGEPDNEAERYFYTASMEVLNQNGVVNCCKLPYENEARDKFVGQKYKLNTSEDVKIRTVYEQISYGGELYAIGKILNDSPTYQKDLISYFLQECNVKDATDKKNLQELLKSEKSIKAKDFLLSSINGTERSDGETDITGETFLSFYADGKDFEEFEDEFRQQMSKSQLKSYAKEIDLITSELLPKLPVYYKFDTKVTDCISTEVSSDYTFEDIEPIDITKFSDYRCNADDLGSDTTLRELISDRDIIYKDVLCEMVNKMKLVYPILASHQTTTSALTGDYFNSTIIEMTDENILDLSVSQVLNMASEMESIAYSGSPVPVGETYAEFIDTIGGQIGYLNDTLTKGYTTDISVETKNGFIEQSVSVLIPYLKEDGGSKEVTNALYKFQNSCVIPYGQTSADLTTVLPDEKDPRWFELTSLEGLGIYDNGTDDVLSDDALYVQFESKPSVMKITEVPINGMNLYYKDGYEWIKLDQISAIEDCDEIRKLVENHAYKMTDLGEKDFKEAYDFIDELNENIDALKAEYLKTINEELLFNEIRHADDTVDIAWKIESKGEPFLCEMTEVDEYRTDEARVGTNEILIVDKTRKSYNKVAEDKQHKDRGQELIGVIPIITTAANALYAQSMINVDKADVLDYETIKNVKTLLKDGF